MRENDGVGRHVVETWNSEKKRVLRITQRDISSNFVGTAGRIVTKIEVLERTKRPNYRSNRDPLDAGPSRLDAARHRVDGGRNNLVGSDARLSDVKRSDVIRSDRPEVTRLTASQSDLKRPDFTAAGFGRSDSKRPDADPSRPNGNLLELSRSELGRLEGNRLEVNRSELIRPDEEEPTRLDEGEKGRGYEGWGGGWIAPDEPSAADQPEHTLLFSVKYTHDAIWQKQLHVHKALLLACILAGVENPIEVPQDSIKVFNSLTNLQHIHIFLERIIPHFTYGSLPPEVSAFWWRAVGNGALVFQNSVTGRLIILLSKGKGLVRAGETLERGLSLLQAMPPFFWTTDEQYARIDSAAQEEGLACGNPVFTDADGVAEAVQSWALEDGVSPWMTKLIVKCRNKSLRNYRYSIGVDLSPTTDPSGNESLLNVFILIQVHCNEPLSRELKAYPVCMVPVPILSDQFSEVTATYLRSLWFLRKLYEFHLRFRDAEASEPVAVKPSSNYLRDIRVYDEKDLSARAKLAGGARLNTPGYLLRNASSRAFVSRLVHSTEERLI